MEFDEEALKRAVAPGVQDVERGLNRAVGQTYEEMQGQPVEEVHAVLMQRLKAEAPALHPNEDKVRKWATDISEGRPPD